MAKVDTKAKSTAGSLGALGTSFQKVGNTSGFGRLEALSGTFSKIDDAATKTTDKLDKFGTKLQIGGAAAVAFAGLAIPKLTGLATAAGDLNETVNKSNVIFGASAATVEKFGEAAAKSTGLSKRAAIDAAATFGTLFTNIGKSSDEAADMSIKLTRLAGDLASFSNTSPEEAVTALGAALRGESEPIRRFGVLLDDATLKQRAMTLAIYDGTGSLTPAQRAQAAYAEILAQTSKQQGDFVRTSGSLANQQRIAKAEFENLKATVGQGVLPAMTSLVSTTNDVLSVFNKLPAGVRAGAGTFAAFGVAGLGVAGSLATVAGTVLRNKEAITKALFEMNEDGTRSLTGLGKAATGLGVAFAGLAIVETIKGINAAASAELDKLARAFDKGTNEQFIEASRRLDLIGKNTEVFDRVLAGNVETAQRWADAIRAAGGDVADWDLKIAQARLNQKKFKLDTEAAGKSVGGFTLAMDKSGRVVRVSSDAVDEYGNLIEKVGDEADIAAPKVLSLKDAQELLNKQTDDSRKIMDDLNKEVSDYAGFLDRILDDTYDLANADSDWNDALLDLQDTVKKNGPAWDIWTRAGIDNNKALQNTITKVGEYIGVLGEDYPGTVTEFRTESSRFITELKKQAEALGVPQAELDKMLSTLLALEAHQEINIAVKATVYTRQQLNDIGAADPTLLGDILGYDTGGMVTGGAKGSETFAKVHVGETVLPTHKMGLTEALTYVVGKTEVDKLPQYGNGGIIGGYTAMRNWSPAASAGGGNTVIVDLRGAHISGVTDFKRAVKEAVIEGSRADGGWNVRLRNAS